MIYIKGQVENSKWGNEWMNERACKLTDCVRENFEGWLDILDE